MTSTDRERWQRVKDQLRKQLGEDVFSSWFGRMELDAADNGTVRLSVPTRCGNRKLKPQIGVSPQRA